MAKTIRFTLGDGRTIDTPLLGDTGTLQVSQTNGEPITFAYDVRENVSYRQEVTGKLIGSGTFTIAVDRDEDSWDKDSRERAEKFEQPYRWYTPRHSWKPESDDAWANDPCTIIYDENSGVYYSHMLFRDGQNFESDWIEMTSPDMNTWVQAMGPLRLQRNVQWKGDGGAQGGSVWIDKEGRFFPKGSIVYVCSSSEFGGFEINGTQAGDQSIVFFVSPGFGQNIGSTKGFLTSKKASPVYAWRDPRLHWDSERNYLMFTVTSGVGVEFWKINEFKDLQSNPGSIEKLGEFKFEDPEMMAETPEFHSMTDKITGEKKWVLVVCTQYKPHGGEGPGPVEGPDQDIRYYVGDWDGHTFKTEIGRHLIEYSTAHYAPAANDPLYREYADSLIMRGTAHNWYYMYDAKPADWADMKWGWTGGTMGTYKLTLESGRIYSRPMTELRKGNPIGNLDGAWKFTKDSFWFDVNGKRIKIWSDGTHMQFDFGTMRRATDFVKPVKMPWKPGDTIVVFWNAVLMSVNNITEGVHYNECFYPKKGERRISDFDDEEIEFIGRIQGGDEAPVFDGKGWEIKDCKWYYKGVETDQTTHVYPVYEDGKLIPSCHVGVNPDDYNTEYGQRTETKFAYIPEGINLNREDYTLCNRFTYGSFGNDPTFWCRGVDGRNYTAQLQWVVPNERRESPMLFSQIRSGKTWAPLFFPVHQDKLQQSGLMSGVTVLHSGSFHIFQEDMKLSGFDFKRGQVLYMFASPPHSPGNPDKIVKGINCGQGNVIIWFVSNSIQEMANDCGVLLHNPDNNPIDVGSDPRMFFENGQIKVVTKQGNTGKKYTLWAIDKLDYQSTYRWQDLDVIIPPVPRDGIYNFECPCPIKVGNKYWLIFSAQVTNSTTEPWNTLRNPDYIQNMDANWNPIGAARMLDVGYDSFAPCASCMDIERAKGDCINSTTCFNWGVVNHSANGGKSPYQQQNSWPFLQFSMESGYIDYQLDDGWKPISGSGRDVVVKKDGTTATVISMDSGIIKLDVSRTANNMFHWKTDRIQFRDIDYNPVQPHDINDITGIYAKQYNKGFRICFKYKSSHDILCSLMFREQGTYTAERL